jgi:hypothetical protein
MITALKLELYIQEHGDNWADKMPDNCPPQDVSVADEEVFFRMIRHDSIIVDEDWFNHLVLFPNKHYSSEDKILAAGLSVNNNLEDIRNKIKLPKLRKYFKGLAKISLIPEDGVILQTGEERSHYTWWRTKMCDLTKAELL